MAYYWFSKKRNRQCLTLLICEKKIFVLFFGRVYSATICLQFHLTFSEPFLVSRTGTVGWCQQGVKVWFYYIHDCIFIVCGRKTAHFFELWYLLPINIFVWSAIVWSCNSKFRLHIRFSSFVYETPLRLFFLCPKIVERYFMQEGCFSCPVDIRVANVVAILNDLLTQWKPT